MKKFKFIVHVTLLQICMVNFGDFDVSDTEKSEFQTYNFEKGTSDEEKRKYYLDNGVFPANIPDISIDECWNQSNITEKLLNRFPYTDWKVDNTKSFEVSDVYGENPIEVSENDGIIQEAKGLAGITSNYIGCGPLALYGQMNYLASSPRYTSIAYEPSRYEDILILAKTVFENVSTIPGDSVGVTGTYTLPANFINGAHKVLQKFGLESPENKINTQIKVHGDEIANFSSLNTKISNVKKSIDNGMPVIWWTTITGTGAYKNHYMNIYGYETWTGKNEVGETYEHLVFKLRMNWGKYQTFYVDSDVFDGPYGGFIFFEEVHKHVGLVAEDYGYPCAYNNEEIRSTFYKNDILVHTTRLRTGYINHFDSNNVLDDQRLVLSGKRSDYKLAYLTWKFEKRIISSNIGLCLWSGLENIKYDQITLSYKSNGIVKDEQVILVSDLSTFFEYPDSFKKEFLDSDNITEITLIVKSESTVTAADKNKGRVVVTGATFVFSDLM